MASDIRVRIIGDASSFNRALRDAETHAGTFESTLGRVGKMAALAAGGAALGGLALTLKAGINEWQESAKVAAQTEAVLKSTGGTANVTADQISSLATALMKKSGVDDETIQSGENLLLTFTNIRNEVGKGNDIFTQATKATLDMSVALGEDMSSASIQLGKALQDPILGLTSLRRVGVEFTEAQREQIKAMVDAGDTMGAQKMILAELTKEFGGSAEAVGRTLPGQIAIARESFKNFAGDIVANVIPALTNAVNYVRDHWPEIQQTIRNVWTAVKPTVDAMIEIVTMLKDTIQKHWATIENVMNVLKTVIVDDLKIVGASLQLIVDIIHGDWGKAWNDVKTIVSSAIDAVVAILRGSVSLIGSAAEAIGRGILDGIVAGLSGLGDAMKRAIEIPINAVIDAWNRIGFDIDIPSVHIPHGPTIGGGSLSFHVPQIPHLAKGGIVTSPMLAMIGEAGPEAVIPLSQAGAGNTYQFTFPNYVGSKDELAQTVVAVLRRANRAGQIPDFNFA